MEYIITIAIGLILYKPVVNALRKWNAKKQNEIRKQYETSRKYEIEWEEKVRCEARKKFDR